jgi:hypothetical protein
LGAFCAPFAIPKKQPNFFEALLDGGPLHKGQWRAKRLQVPGKGVAETRLLATREAWLLPSGEHGPPGETAICTCHAVPSLAHTSPSRPGLLRTVCVPRSTHSNGFYALGISYRSIINSSSSSCWNAYHMNYLN